jgi:hypothetical protein
MPDPSTPCGQATPETASWPFWRWPACRAGGLRASSSPLDTPSCTGLVLTAFYCFEIMFFLFNFALFTYFLHISLNDYRFYQQRQQGQQQRQQEQQQQQQQQQQQ